MLASTIPSANDYRPVSPTPHPSEPDPIRNEKSLHISVSIALKVTIEERILTETISRHWNSDRRETRACEPPKTSPGSRIARINEWKNVEKMKNICEWVDVDEIRKFPSKKVQTIPFQPPFKASQKIHLVLDFPFPGEYLRSSLASDFRRNILRRGL